MPVYFGKAGPFPQTGWEVGGVKKRKAKERRRWREGVADAEVGDCGSRLGRSSEPTIITSS